MWPVSEFITVRVSRNNRVLNLIKFYGKGSQAVDEIIIFDFFFYNYFLLGC